MGNRRFARAPLLVLFLSWPLAGQALGKVGVAQRSFVPNEPYIWRGAKTHALVTTIWYPAASGSGEQPQWVGPPDAPLFAVGSAAPAARPAPGKFPLIVLSHGTGGSALMLGWLGTVLAAHGYVAAAVNHPGNNALEDYTAAGFSLWWERAKDLSEVIDHMLADPELGAHIDEQRIAAAGFSLGGYTMIAIAGGITDRTAYREFCESPRADGICKAPPEFPNLLEYFSHLEETAKSDPEVADSLKHEKESHRDRRVRAVFAIAPALGPAFRPAGLGKIAIPVEIVAGKDDDNVPVASSAQYFAKYIHGSKLVLLEGGVRHYEFLGTCTPLGSQSLPLLCTGKPGVDRDSVHRQVAAMAVKFFDRQLGTARR
ncbi:MAG TPA: prolyl oligopeptidase family serine peptidase [Bryobacteraceae bacterium]